MLGWTYAIFSVDTFSFLLGILEISIAVLIAGHLLSPKLSRAITCAPHPEGCGPITASRKRNP
jgi:hypothetical protein